MSDGKAVFDPIDHGSVVDEVVGQIETMIVSGVLKEGHKLPSERELAEVLKVSRPKLREALKRLECDDLIVVKHGDGTFVGPLVGNAMSPALSNLYSRHTGAFFDYLEYRREQEGFAAELAAERMTQIDREVIQEVLIEMDQAHESGDRKAARKADIDFHSAVVGASHNTTLIHMMTSIYDLSQRTVFYNRDYLHTVENSAEALLEQHHGIAEAIFARDPQTAKQNAYDHIDYVARSFRQGQEVTERTKIASKMRMMGRVDK